MKEKLHLRYWMTRLNSYVLPQWSMAQTVCGMPLSQEVPSSIPSNGQIFRNISGIFFDQHISDLQYSPWNPTFFLSNFRCIIFPSMPNEPFFPWKCICGYQSDIFFHCYWRWVIFPSMPNPPFFPATSGQQSPDNAFVVSNPTFFPMQLPVHNISLEA